MATVEAGPFAGMDLDPSVQAWAPPPDLTAREVCELPLPEGDPVWGPLWPGFRLIVSGDPGQGKTSLVFAIADAVAHGKEFLGWQGCGGPVLVFDVEMGLRSVQKALTKAKLHESDAVRYYRCPDGLELEKDGADEPGSLQLAWMVGLIAEHQPAMVVIDPLYKMHGGDTNDEREMLNLLRKLDRIRDEHGFVLTIPMHLRKRDPKQGGDFTLNDVFGSGALTRGPEVVMGIRKSHPGASRLLWLKDRDGEMQGSDKWNLTWSAEDGFERDKDDVKPVPVQIQEAFLVGGAGAMTKREIAKSIGVSARRASDWIKGMMEDGYLVETDRPAAHGEKMYVMETLLPETDDA